MAIKNPMQAAMMSVRSIESGQEKRCATMSRPCMRAKAAATYATAHCTNLRCLRRCKNSFIAQWLSVPQPVIVTASESADLCGADPRMGRAEGLQSLGRLELRGGAAM